MNDSGRLVKRGYAKLMRLISNVCGPNQVAFYAVVTGLSGYLVFNSLSLEVPDIFSVLPSVAAWGVGAERPNVISSTFLLNICLSPIWFSLCYRGFSNRPESNFSGLKKTIAITLIGIILLFQVVIFGVQETDSYSKPWSSLLELIRHNDYFLAVFLSLSVASTCAVFALAIFNIRSLISNS